MYCTVTTAFTLNGNDNTWLWSTCIYIPVGKVVLTSEIDKGHQYSSRVRRQGDNHLHEYQVNIMRSGHCKRKVHLQFIVCCVQNKPLEAVFFLPSVSNINIVQII